MANILSKLQLQILEQLFANEDFAQQFFLTGGSALSWAYLEHRISEDLDFFSRDAPDLNKIDLLLREILAPVGIELQEKRTGPAFRRYLAVTQTETTLLDLVTQDQAPVDQLVLKENIKLDSILDIAVNKVIALEREEVKDSVDLYLLLKTQNLDIFDLLEKAKIKTMDAENEQYPLRIARLLHNAGKLPNFDKLQLVSDIDQNEMTQFLQEQAAAILEQYR